MNPDGSGRGGVAVSLSGSTLAAVTASDGTWAFSGTTGVQSRSVPFAHPTGNLRIQDGRLRVDLSGRDLTGRFLSSGHSDANRSSVPAPRSLGAVPDTLLYRVNGKVFLRDTVSESRSGMVRVYDTTWNADIVYGYLTDARDGQTYRSVKIGSQVWMAQNLNSAEAGVCYNGSTDSCSKYGRLYTWAEVMQGSSSSAANPSGVKGICPTGWHVPSDTEWTVMQKVVDAFNATDGTKLKSTAGWYSSRNGTDTYGFRALPAGLVGGGGSNYAGNNAYFWSASEYDASNAWLRYFSGGLATVYRYYYNKSNWFSLRCRQN